MPKFRVALLATALAVPLAGCSGDLEKLLALWSMDPRAAAAMEQSGKRRPRKFSEDYAYAYVEYIDEDTYHLYVGRQFGEMTLPLPLNFVRKGENKAVGGPDDVAGLRAFVEERLEAMSGADMTVLDVVEAGSKAKQLGADDVKLLIVVKFTARFETGEQAGLEFSGKFTVNDHVVNIAYPPD